jgi:hypothetical protein
LALAARVLDLSLRVTLTCALGAAAGYGLDRLLGWHEHVPVLTMAGCVLGFALGLVGLVRGLQAMERSEKGGSGRRDDGRDGAGPEA